MIINFRAAVFLVLLSGSLALADDPDRGRLPDGRAFRTDNDGNQLVDYIAELEVQNETLKKHLNALEYQNEQRQGQAALPVPRLPEPVAMTQPDDSACKAQLTMAQEAASSARFDLELQRKKFDEQLASQQNRISELEQQLLVTTQRVKAVEGQAAARVAAPDRVPVAEVVTYEPSLTEIKKEAVAAEEPRARFESEPTSLARDRAMVTVRGSISTELNKLRSLISQRDKLFADYNRNRPPVTLRVTALRSSRDMTVNDIERVLQRADSVYQLTTIRADINELRGTVNEDIGLVQRMNRTR